MLYVCFSSCLPTVGLSLLLLSFLETKWLTLILSKMCYSILRFHKNVSLCTIMLPSIFHRNWGGFPSFMVFYILRTNLLSSKLEPPRQPKYGCPRCQRWDKGAHCWIHMVCFLCFADSAAQRLPVHTSSVSFSRRNFQTATQDSSIWLCRICK